MEISSCRKAAGAVAKVMYGSSVPLVSLACSTSR
jgi:hypothetical protein